MKGFVLRSADEPSKTISSDEMADFVEALISKKGKKKVILQDAIQIQQDHNLQSKQLQKVFSPTDSFTKMIIRKGEKRCYPFGYTELHPTTKKVKK